MHIVRGLMIKETQYCRHCDSQYSVQYRDEDVDPDLVPSYCPFCGAENYGEVELIDEEEYE
jgi:hypothetical protein